MYDFCILLAWTVKVAILPQKFEKVIKTNQNVPKTVGNHWEQFWSKITILVILASKKAKKTQILRSKICRYQQQKYYRNPFFRQFEPPKGYIRVCHRYIGKVTRFGLFRIIIFRSNCHFLVGRAENAPPQE